MGRVAALDIILTTNSPGEVSAWLAPAVRALRKRAPGATISVFVPPCTFASGAECPVVAAMPEVDHVYGPAAFLRYVLFGRRPAGFHPGKHGVVCFLGGDLMYAAWLARRLRYPALAYNEGRARWFKSYRLFLVPDQAAERRAHAAGAPSENVKVIGDLMLDAIRPQAADQPAARRLFGIEPGVHVVSLFPGSRPFEIQPMLPFLMRTAEVVQSAADRPVRFLLSLAPFVGHETLAHAAGQILPGFEGVTAQVSAIAPPADGSFAGAWLLSTSKVQVAAYQGAQYDIMLASDLAITVPGSNTAEMAGMGLPMVVALPLNQPEAIPLEGLPGLIGRIPVIGPKLKRSAVHKAAARVKFAALPNRKAGEMLVPEVRGTVRPEDVAYPVVDLLRRSEKRKALGKRLREIMGEPGAADRLAEQVVAFL